MNRAVGLDELGVLGNHSKVSHGGQLIREMVKEYNYVTVNNMAVGGPWTWVQRGKETVMSCLDLAYASQNLVPFIKQVTIDKDRKDKTSFIVCGSSSFKQSVKLEIQDYPMIFGDFVMKEKISDKYLGQVLHGGGLEESALATAQERAGKIRGATMEINLL